MRLLFITLLLITIIVIALAFWLNRNKSKTTTLSAKLQLLDSTNSERKKSGIPTVNIDEDLSLVAQAHSEDMAQRNYFSSITPEGLGPNERARKLNYFKTIQAENIGKTGGTNVLDLWLNNSSHRQNILGNYKNIGIGLAKKDEILYWVAMFSN